MPSPRFEVLAGVIDGVNTVFTSSVAYTPGTSAVFLNGQLKRITYDDGWTETSPPAGTITMMEPPDLLDVVQMFYLDTSPPAVVVQAGPEPLSATIQDISSIDATIVDVENLSAEMAASQALDASFEDTSQFDGSMVDVERLDATMECSP